MTRVACRVLMMTSLVVPLVARAEGKCDDDPYYWQAKRMLVVTWTIPYPADATSVVDDVPPADVKLMADLDNTLGAVPQGFPQEHGNHIEYPYPPQPNPPDFPNSKKPLTSVDEVKKYLGDFNMRLEPEAEQYFTEYLDKNKKNTLMYARVVQHPSDPVKVPKNGVGFRFCTCMLQRAVAIWEPPAQPGKDKRGTEQLWVRSRFRSFRDPAHVVNFAPTKPVKFTFPRSGVWFPLAFNTIIPEPGVSAFLLLDVLTKTKLNLKDADVASALSANQLSAAPAAQTFQYGDSTWHVTRIWRKYQRGDPAEDLELPVK